MSTILELENSINSSVHTEFINRLSNKPYCSNDLDYGLQIRNKETALARKYIQANTPWNLSWLCFDIDYPCVLETTFKEKTLPTPNFMIVNPKNHHSHLLYGIDKMVHLTDNASIDPIRYAHAVEIALRDELKADIGYTGLIIKNPQHKHWITQELNQNLWGLGELAEYLTLPNKIPKKELGIGLGRNCTLFELGRYFAYSQVLRFKITNTKENFYNLIPKEDIVQKSKDKQKEEYAEDYFNIVTVARLTPGKGYEIALLILKELIKEVNLENIIDSTIKFTLKGLGIDAEGIS